MWAVVEIMGTNAARHGAWRPDAQNGTSIFTTTQEPFRDVRRWSWDPAAAGGVDIIICSSSRRRRRSSSSSSSSRIGVE